MVIKMKKIKWIVLAILLLVFSFFGYKFYQLKKYDYPITDNYEEIIKGITITEELTILKKSINEDYLSAGNLKIRNDFQEYQLEENNSYDPNATIRYEKYENDEIVSKIGFFVDELSTKTNIDTFISDVELFDGSDDSAKKYNSANRKKILEDNSITNDIEFYEYLVKNYPFKSNIFSSVETMKNNYALNTFFDVAIPLVKSLKAIKGDYSGLVYYIGNDVVEVELFHNNKRYGFFTDDKRFLDDNYLIDIIGTIEFMN